MTSTKYLLEAVIQNRLKVTFHFNQFSEDFLNYFSKFGKIKEVRMMNDPKTSKKIF